MPSHSWTINVMLSFFVSLFVSWHRNSSEQKRHLRLEYLEQLLGRSHDDEEWEIPIHSCQIAPPIYCWTPFLLLPPFSPKTEPPLKITGHPSRHVNNMHLLMKRRSRQCINAHVRRGFAHSCQEHPWVLLRLSIIWRFLLQAIYISPPTPPVVCWVTEPTEERKTHSRTLFSAPTCTQLSTDANCCVPTTPYEVSQVRATDGVRGQYLI